MRWCCTVLIHVARHRFVESQLIRMLATMSSQCYPILTSLTGELGLELSELLSNDNALENIALFGEADGELI